MNKGRRPSETLARAIKTRTQPRTTKKNGHSRRPPDVDLQQQRRALREGGDGFDGGDLPPVEAGGLDGGDAGEGGEEGGEEGEGGGELGRSGRGGGRVGVRKGGGKEGGASPRRGAKNETPAPATKKTPSSLAAPSSPLPLTFPHSSQTPSPLNNSGASPHLIDFPQTLLSSPLISPSGQMTHSSSATFPEVRDVS